MSNNQSWLVDYVALQSNTERDVFREWYITPDDDATPDDVVLWFFANVYHRVPEWTEWQREVSDIGSHVSDDVYFREGQYTVRIENGKYHFIAVSPYLDSGGKR